MRKTAFLVTPLAVFSLTASVAHAWDFCIQDQQYTPQLQINIEAAASGPDYLVRGQAVLSEPGWPAPIAGYFNPSTRILSITIGYKTNDASRHYAWFLNSPGTPAVTWGVLPDGTYYDNPRLAGQIVACTPATDLGQEGEIPLQLGKAISSLPPAVDSGQGGKTGTPYEK